MSLRLAKFGALAIVLTVSALTPKANAGQPEAYNCEIWDGDAADGSQEETALGHMTLKFDAAGAPIALSADRRAYGKTPAFSAHLTKANASLRMIEVKPTKEDIENSAFGAVTYSKITGTDHAGHSISLALNDHMYAGTTGSTAVFKSGPVTIKSEDDSMIFCRTPQEDKERQAAISGLAN